MILCLRDLGHMMRAQYEGKASQKRILILLGELGTVTQRALTERLGIQPGSASEILGKLESAGLISRVPNTEDRRTTDLRLTPAGKEQAEEAAAQRRERHERMFACLSEEEKDTLLGLMETLRGNWKSYLKEHPQQNNGPHGEHGHHHGHGPHGGPHGHGDE